MIIFHRLVALSFLISFLGIGGGALADQELNHLSPDMVAESLVSSTPPLILDARGRDLYSKGTIPGAVNAGRDPEGFLPSAGSGKLVVILRKGSPSATKRAWTDRLKPYGYSVSFLKGGLEAWQAAGMPVEIPASGHVKPGSTPYIIPRGLCENNTPAQVRE